MGIKNVYDLNAQRNHPKPPPTHGYQPRPGSGKPPPPLRDEYEQGEIGGGSSNVTPKIGGGSSNVTPKDGDGDGGQEYTIKINFGFPDEKEEKPPEPSLGIRILSYIILAAAVYGVYALLWG